MSRSRHIIFVTAILSVAAIAAAIAYHAHFKTRAQSDEFAVYEAFLSRLSDDWVSRPNHLPPNAFALADTSSKLVVATGETWMPTELRPYPPEEAAPPDRFIDFCGSWCGHEFMRNNLETWPHSKVYFSFDVLPASSEIRPEERGKRIVSVTRPGFDFTVLY
jgi:hypothetical protein